MQSNRVCILPPENPAAGGKVGELSPLRASALTSQKELIVSERSTRAPNLPGTIACHVTASNNRAEARLSRRPLCLSCSAYITAMDASASLIDPPLLDLLYRLIAFSRRRHSTTHFTRRQSFTSATCAPTTCFLSPPSHSPHSSSRSPVVLSTR